MTATSGSTSVLLALALLVFVAAGCDGDGDGSDTVIDAAVVEEFRSETAQRAHEVDTGIAALEAEGALADSATSAAYQEAIGRLLESRHVLQQGLVSLDTLTTAQFGIVSDSLARQVEILEQRVNLAPFELAPDLAALREVARRRIGLLRGEIDELQADADSTLDAALFSLDQRGEAFSASLNAASEDTQDALRTSLADSLLTFRANLDALKLRLEALEIPNDSVTTE